MRSLTSRVPARATSRAALALSVSLAAACALPACGGTPAPEPPSEGEEELVVTDGASPEPLEGTEEEDRADTSEGSGPAQDEDQQPAYDVELQRRLQGQLDGLAQASGMQVGIALVDLSDGMPVSSQGQVRMPSASMIKLLIASTLLQRIDAGDLALDATHVLAADEIVGGAGSLAYLGVGASVTYERLLAAMIEESDNTAANALICDLGFDEVNAEAARLGLTQTVLARKMMDEAALAEGRENYTCADDLAHILQATYEGTLASPELCQLLVADLERQQDAGGIRAGLPGDVAFAHKTGTLDYARHDGGIVEGAHPFVIVVLCGGDGFYEEGALAAMAQAARVSYDALATPAETE